MKRTLIAASITILTLPIAGHAKCRFGIEEPNHIETKQAPWKAKAIQALHARLGNKDGDYYLLTIFTSMGKKVEFNSDTPLELQLVNGENIALFPADPESSKRTLLGLAINNRRAETLYLLDRGQLNSFRSNALTNVRMHFVHDGIKDVEDFPIGSRSSERFMEYSACVLEYEE